MKKRDLILINPPLTLEERYGDLGAAGTDTAPLGLCYLAAMARRGGYSVSILDAPALGFSLDETITAVLAASPRYVGITATVIAIDRAGSLAGALKGRMPGVPVILGGPQVTADPRGVLEGYPGIDIGVFGEGEETLIELLGALRHRRELSAVPGLILRQDGDIILTGAREYIKNLDALPMPAWDLLPQPLGNYYEPAVFTTKQTPSFSLVTSRGCYGTCIFCDKAVFGSKCRWHSAQSVLAMMRDLHDTYGIREFAIADDLFVMFKERVFELCRLIRESGMKVSWSCNARADFVTEEMLVAMRQSGCWQIAYGIESASEEILRNIRKGMDLKKAKETIRLTRRHGIRVRGYFMFGSPGETVQTMKQTIAFVKDAGIDDFQLTYFTPLPGSEIYERAEEFGRFDRNTKTLNYWRPSFVPYTVTPGELEYYYKRAYRTQYFRPRTVLSYAKMIRSPRHLWRLIQSACSLARMVFRGPRRTPDKEGVALDP
ncbi:MAG: cobalamin-dependent protein [Candidatus Omnitrophica bacterium]|nr:cobalamin-dependent protein [Candidatus Omnitrophota bacterium]